MKVIVERVDTYSDLKPFIKRVFDFFKPDLNEAYIKPNFLKFDRPENGCITHPEVVKTILDVLSELGVKSTVVEGGFYRDSAEKCFQAFGLHRYAECINLNRDEFVKIDVDGEALTEIKVAKTSLKIARGEMKFISVPKMKVHHLTKVTLSIKNNMGFLKKPAIYMHPNIHKKLVDLLRVFNPSLVIIDGITGGERSESRTKPVQHGVMIASNSGIAADAVAATLMGFEVKEVPHIRFAAEKFGIEMNNIKIYGDTENLRKKYSLSAFSRFLGSVGI
jgi:uncharacterized protein (DUF362 family)